MDLHRDVDRIQLIDIEYYYKFMGQWTDQNGKELKRNYMVSKFFSNIFVYLYIFYYITGDRSIKLVLGPKTDMNPRARQRFFFKYPLEASEPPRKDDILLLDPYKRLHYTWSHG